MKVFYCDHFTFPLPQNHRFPLAKYSLLRKRLEESGLIPTEDLLVPDAATDEELLLVHTQEYLHQVRDGLLSEKAIRRIGLPWSPELVERSRRSVGGTIAACRAASVLPAATSIAAATLPSIES